MGKFQNTNNELMARISAVNDLIKSNYITPPPERFALTQPEISIKQCRTSAFLSLLSCTMLAIGTLLSPRFSIFRLLLPVGLLVSSIISFISISTMKKFRIDVNGQEITVKGKTCHSSETMSVAMPIIRLPLQPLSRLKVSLLTALFAKTSTRSSL